VNPACPPTSSSLSGRRSIATGNGFARENKKQRSTAGVAFDACGFSL